jgi:hypothetical protein
VLGERHASPRTSATATGTPPQASETPTAHASRPRSP